MNDLKVIINTCRQNTKVVNWYLGKRCNYSCSYCSDYLHDRISPDHGIKKLILAYKNLKKWIGQDSCQICFTGGEPTLNPDFIKLLSYLKENHSREGLILTTNGSATLEAYRETFPLLHAMTISYHLEFTQDDQILKKIENLFRYSSIEKKWFAVNLMFKPGQLTRMKNIMAQLNSIGCQYYLLKVRPKEIFLTENQSYEHRPQDELPYSEEEKAFLENYYQHFPQEEKTVDLIFENGEMKSSHGNYIMAHEMNRFNGWACEAGIRDLTIWNDGTIHRCEADIGTKGLGNIYQKDLTIEIKPLRICPVDKCVCLSEIEISKKKIV